jgi:hypothetical protein
MTRKGAMPSPSSVAQVADGHDAVAATRLAVAAAAHEVLGIGVRGSLAPPSDAEAIVARERARAGEASWA